MEEGKLTSSERAGDGRGKRIPLLGGKGTKTKGFETHRWRTRGVAWIDLDPKADASRPDPTRTARSFQRGGGKGSRSGSDPNTSGYETPLWIGS